MNTYELTVIFSSAFPPEEQKKIISKTQKQIEEEKGHLISVEDWGKKPLAYPILNLNEGFYSLLKFSISPEAANKINNNLRLDDNVLRHLLIRLADKKTTDATTRSEMENGKWKMEQEKVEEKEKPAVEKKPVKLKTVKKAKKGV